MAWTDDGAPGDRAAGPGSAGAGSPPVLPSDSVHPTLGSFKGKPPLGEWLLNEAYFPTKCVLQPQPLTASQVSQLFPRWDYWYSYNTWPGVTKNLAEAILLLQKINTWQP